MLSPCSASAARMRAMVPSSTSSSGASARRRANSSSLMGGGGAKRGQERADLLRRHGVDDLMKPVEVTHDSLRCQRTLRLHYIERDAIRPPAWFRSPHLNLQTIPRELPHHPRQTRWRIVRLLDLNSIFSRPPVEIHQSICSRSKRSTVCTSCVLNDPARISATRSERGPFWTLSGL